MSVKKKANSESFNTSIISDAAYLISKPLQHIYNASLQCGRVPDSFKIAKVIPIYKKGDTSCMSNYRPISLLPVFDKILEKLVCNRLLKFWTKYNVLYDYQFGFRKNHSTTLALIEITDNIYNWLENNNYVIGLYLDIQKAFDTVSHALLLKKL